MYALTFHVCARAHSIMRDASAASASRVRWCAVLANSAAHGQQHLYRYICARMHSGSVQSIQRPVSQRSAGVRMCVCVRGVAGATTTTTTSANRCADCAQLRAHVFYNNDHSVVLSSVQQQQFETGARACGFVGALTSVHMLHGFWCVDSHYETRARSLRYRCANIIMH